MKILLIPCLALISSISAQAQTDAYLKLNDKDGKHPRIKTITFPGNADNLIMYNSIYGHGAVIENPWVAYRIYMDNRQSLDLYVKHKPGLELEQTGFYTTPEQLEQGYGCDVLWAGKSIGAGSFRGWNNGEILTVDNVGLRTQTVNSPSCAEVKDTDWLFNGHYMDMSQKYSVKSDSDALYVEITLSGYEPDDLFCTGIQKLETNNSGIISPEGYAASLGSNIPDKNMPELVETVALGIVVNEENLVQAYEDNLNYIFVVRPDSQGKIRYKVIASGSRADGFSASAAEWFDRIASLR